MPTLRLTDAAIKKLKRPESGRVEYWDTHTRGFGLRCSESGVRSWVLITRSLKVGQWKQQRVTLGKYPAVSLAQARRRAEEAKARAEQGDDPAATVKADKLRMIESSRNTYGLVTKDFLSKYRGRQNRRPAKSTLEEMTRILTGADFKAWWDAPMAKLTQRDVMDALDAILNRGAERQANKTLSYLKLLFGWATHRGILEVDPTLGVKKPGAEVTRDRVLSADELRLIWQATEGDDSQFNGIVRLLMLTGQRLNEVAQLPWREIDMDARLWALPSERAKNHREHIIPLTEPALRVLTEGKTLQTAIARRSKPAPKLVFTTNGTTPFSGFSKAKRRLDAAINAADTIPHWTPHDIRRSVATHMAEELRIAPHIIDAVLNHVSGTKAGVAGVYNRALHLDERRDALDAWARHLMQITGENLASNIVELRA